MRRILVAVLAILAIVLAAPSMSSALPVLQGDDLLTTVAPTFFNSPFGAINFAGNPPLAGTPSYDVWLMRIFLLKV